MVFNIVFVLTSECSSPLFPTPLSSLSYTYFVICYKFLTIGHKRLKPIFVVEFLGFFDTLVVYPIYVSFGTGLCNICLPVFGFYFSFRNLVYFLVPCNTSTLVLVQCNTVK